MVSHTISSATEFKVGYAGGVGFSVFGKDIDRKVGIMLGMKIDGFWESYGAVDWRKYATFHDRRGGFSGWWFFKESALKYSGKRYA